MEGIGKKMDGMGISEITYDTGQGKKVPEMKRQEVTFKDKTGDYVMSPEQAISKLYALYEPGDLPKELLQRVNQLSNQITKIQVIAGYGFIGTPKKLIYQVNDKKWSEIPLTYGNHMCKSEFETTF